MTGFIIQTKSGEEIRFRYDLENAPVTAKAFHAILPFTRVFYHARVSGQEIWIDDVPPLDIHQENASTFALPGEAIVGPSKPVRNKTANCFGFYYGEGKGLDAANIFAKVNEPDFPKLTQLGNDIWKKGAQELTILPY